MMMVMILMTMLMMAIWWSSLRILLARCYLCLSGGRDNDDEDSDSGVKNGCQESRAPLEESAI